MSTTRLLNAALLSIWLLLMGTAPAYAYLDPGTGSLLLQILLGGLAGLAAIGKLYWSHIKDFFARLSGKPRPTLDEDDDDTPKNPQ